MRSPLIRSARSCSVGFVLIATPWLPAATPSLDAVEQLAVQWAQLRVETGRLESDWSWQQDILGTTRDALEARVRQLKAERELHQATQHQVRAEIATRTADNTASRVALDAIDADVRRLSARAVALQRWLPPRLAQALELPTRSLADPALPLTERVQLLATFQSRCNQFNRMLTASEEVLTLPGDDHSRLYEIVYWGLAGAYALDAERDRAFRGYPGADGWTWEPMPDGANEVRRLLAVHRDQTPPAFVLLPAQLHQVDLGREEATP